MSAVPTLIELLNKPKSKDDAEREALLPQVQAAVSSSGAGDGKPSTDSAANTPSSARADANGVTLTFAFNMDAQAHVDQAGTYGASAAHAASNAAGADVKAAAEPRSAAPAAAPAAMPISREELTRRVLIEKKEEMDCFKRRSAKDVNRFGNDFNERRLYLEQIHRDEIMAQASVEKTIIGIPPANTNFGTSVHLVSNRLLGTYLGIRKKVAKLQLKQKKLQTGEETLESLIGYPPNYKELHYSELTADERKQLIECLAKSILDGVQIMRRCNTISRDDLPETHAEYLESLSHGNERLPDNDFNPNNIELVRREQIPNKAEHDAFIEEYKIWISDETKHPLKVFARLAKELLDKKTPPSPFQRLARRIVG